MIARLLSQLILSTALLQMYPYDAGVVERRALSPYATERAVPALADLFARIQRPVPALLDPTRAPIKVQPTSVGTVTSAVSATVVDRATGEVLYEKNAEEPRSIGSITKLMTAFLFLQGRPDLDAPAAVEPGDVEIGGVQHLRVGDQVTARDLLHASLVGSDNSATMALVRLSGLSEGDFVARMNETAAEIGMEHTTFADPSGLSPENRSVAPDIARMLDRLLREATIREATQQSLVSFSGASGRTYTVKTTDELLETYLNREPYKIVGGKTGFLPEAGYCLGTVISESGGHEIIVVVLGSDTKEGRFQDVKSLAAWTYKVFDWPDEHVEES